MVPVKITSSPSMAARRRKSARAAFRAIPKGIDTVAQVIAKAITMGDETLIGWVDPKMRSNVHTDKVTENRVDNAKRKMVYAIEPEINPTRALDIPLSALRITNTGRFLAANP